VTRSGIAALTLSEEIRDRFDEFSRSQKDMGQYIVDHLDEAAFHTAEGVGRSGWTNTCLSSTSSSAGSEYGRLTEPGGPKSPIASRGDWARSRRRQSSKRWSASGTQLRPTLNEEAHGRTRLSAARARLLVVAREVVSS
jgi:hypothetical protein